MGAGMSDTERLPPSLPRLAQLVAGAQVALVLLTALPLGGARPWAWHGLLTGVALLALIWAAASFFGTRANVGARLWPLVAPWRVGLPMLLYTLALAWALLQLWPGMPAVWHHPAWVAAAAVLGQENLPGSISLTPGAGMDGFAKLLGYGLIFLLALQFGRSSRFAWAALRAVAGFTALLALYGLVNALSGAERIGWLEKWAYRGMVTGSFVNPNHFSTWAGFGLIAALALMLRDDPGERRLRAFWLALLVILLAGLALSFSRAGIAAVALGVLMLLAGVVMRRRGWPGVGRLGVVVAALALPALFLLTGEGDMGERAASALGHRGQIYAMALELIAERPWLGSGLGSFSDASAKLRPIGMVLIWGEAHNVYLELMVDLGVPAALSLLLAQALLLWRCLEGALQRQSVPGLSLVALAAGVIAAAHSLLDFSLQIPAVAALWALLLGLGVAQSWSARQGRYLA